MRWGFAVDLERCVGCHACAIACKAENGTTPDVYWMRVLEREEGEYPRTLRMFTPVRCNHCANPPCVAACPSGAFVQRPDGIVYVDQSACFGDRVCHTACPYYIPVRWDGGDGYFGKELTPYETVKYAQFRVGTAMKCHFCYHRIDAGREPACVEVCPARALSFGDLDDPDSEINAKLRARRHIRPRAELGTDPSLFYLVGDGGGSIGGMDAMEDGRA